jgi:predicted O-methyltransferase YrrM
MSKRLVLTQSLYDYLLALSPSEPEVLRRLREETATLKDANMQIPREQGWFIAWLVQLMGAKKVLEAGVFTGYSTLWMALALPPEGYIIACDINEEWTNVAQRYWIQAGVRDKIDLRLSPASHTMKSLINGGQAESFDFIFIDADKESYWEYFELALQLLRPGGVVVVDNVLWDGKLIDPTAQDSETVALRSFNRKLSRDQRVILSFLPVADGLALVLKPDER